MNKILGYLGLARRANKISYGETAMEDILSSRSKLVLISSECGNNTKKKFIDKCNSHNIEYIMIDNSEDYSNAIGKTNIKCFSINDINFARLIKNNYKE